MNDKFNSLIEENKKVFIIFSSVITIIILLILGYKIGGGFKNTSGNVYSKLQNAITTNNTKKLSNIIRVDGKKVSEDDLKPFLKYYKNKDKLNSLFSRLTINENDIEDFIDIKSRNLKIQTNFKGTKILLEDKLVGETSEDNSSVIVKNLIPGVYKIKVINNGEFCNLSDEKETVIDDKDVVEDIYLKGIKVTINYPLNDGKVLVNGETTEFEVEDFKDIGPMPIDGSIKLSILNNLPWGEIKSEEIPVYDIPVLNIPLKFDNDKLVNMIQDISKEFYDSLFKALNNGDKSLVNNSTDQVEDKIFGLVEKKYKYFKNNYVVDALEFSMESSEFKYDTTFEANIIVNLNYSICKNMLGIKFTETKESKKIMTKLAYMDNRWIIKDVENFNL